jgi:hypothetical protein
MKNKLFLLALLFAATCLVSCAGGGSELENAAWKEARKENTLEAIDSFLLKFPETTKKAQIAKARDGMLWQTALLSDSEFYYRSYLAEFPQGKHKVDAEKKLSEMPNDNVNLGELTAKTFVGTIHQGDKDYDVLSLRFDKIEEQGDNIKFTAAVHLSSDIRKQLSGTIVKPNFTISFVENDEDEFTLNLTDGRAYIRNGEIMMESIDTKQYWHLK